MNIQLIQDIENIKKLEDGWCNGDGEKISEKIFEQVSELLCYISKSIKIEVSIVPTISGGVEINWENNSIVLILEDDIAHVMSSLKKAIVPTDIESEIFKFPQEIEKCGIYIIDLLKK